MDDNLKDGSRGFLTKMHYIVLDHLHRIAINFNQSTIHPGKKFPSTPFSVIVNRVSKKGYKFGRQCNKQYAAAVQNYDVNLSVKGDLRYDNFL